jgi:hypothetical protein
MRNRKFLFMASIALFSVLAFTAVPAEAKPNEFDRIAKHLKTNYKAKKISFGFMWLARAAVKIVRPAGVKSFNLTLYKDLEFSKENLDLEMQRAMRESFGSEWSSVLRVRANQGGDQVYMYMREEGKNVKIALVTVNKENAAVVRATFSPEKLAEFINDPKIFGISLKDNDGLGSINTSIDEDHDK